MLIGLVVLGMTLGGAAATAALISGKSLLLAMALYAGCGSASVLAMAITVVAVTTLRDRGLFPAQRLASF